MSRTIKHAARPPSLERSPQVDLAGLQNSIAFALRLAQVASFAAFARRTRQTGLKAGHYAILRLIAANGGIAYKALGRATGTGKSTLSPIISALIKQGFVKRGASEADRRSQQLRLTARGEKALQHLAAHAFEHDRVLDELVGDKNKPLLLRLLNKIAEALQLEQGSA